MEELREVTYQYANVADPTESAARCQRVLQSEAEGLMEETAARIVETASNNLRVYEERNMANPYGASFTLNTPTLVGNEEVSQTPAAVRRTRSGTTPFRRTQASPRLFTGTNLRKHNIAQSSQRHGFPHASPILATQRRTPRTANRRPNSSTNVSTAPVVESSDLHAQHPLLP